MLPPGSDSWPELELITIDQLRKALFTFPANSAVGQTGLHPRQLQHLSDQAMLTLSLLFTACEQQLGWPPDRLATILVRLPKPDGGTRLIGLLNTLVRIWGRARRAVSAGWLQQHKSQHSWGTGPGRSSSASAFSLSLDNEIDVAMGNRTVTLMIDLWKCFELIDPSTLMQEAQAVQYPPRMAWMLIQAYRQPRTLRAHGSASKFFISEQGIIAGCSHATTILEVLLYRAMRRLSARCPTITPRQLVDDISLRWAGTAELCAEEV